MFKELSIFHKTNFIKKKWSHDNKLCLVLKLEASTFKVDLVVIHFILREFLHSMQRVDFSFGKYQKLSDIETLKMFSHN